MTEFRKQLIRHAAALAVIFAFVATVISTLALLYGETWRSKWMVLALGNGAYWLLIFYLLWIILKRAPPDFLGIPRVISFQRQMRVLMVESSPWLSLGVLTAIYLVEDKVERLVCVGEVLNVQTNGLVQIRVMPDDRGFVSENEIEAAFAGEKVHKILVKPGLYPRGAS